MKQYPNAMPEVGPECISSNWFNVYAGSLAGCQHISHIVLHNSFCNFDDRSVKMEKGMVKSG